MRRHELDNAVAAGPRGHHITKGAKHRSFRRPAVHILVTTFSAFAFATASAQTITSDADIRHTVTGTVDFSEPTRPDGNALTSETLSYQERLVQTPQGSINASNDTLSEVLEKAQTMIGIPYVWGGNTPEEGLDCSGFVRYVYETAAGILLPRLSAQISRKGRAIAQTDLHPGDLVFFNTPRGDATHVGIYVGGQRFIHAPRKGAFIRVESMKSAYWTSRYYGARRVVA